MICCGVWSSCRPDTLADRHFHGCASRRRTRNKSERRRHSTISTLFARRLSSQGSDKRRARNGIAIRRKRERSSRGVQPSVLIVSRLGERDMPRGPCRSQPNCIAALVYITAVQCDLTLSCVAHRCLVFRPNSDQHVLLTIDTRVRLGRAPQPLPHRVVPGVHSAGPSGECRSDLSNLLEEFALKCLSFSAERQRSDHGSPRAECHLYVQMGKSE